MLSLSLRLGLRELDSLAQDHTRRMGQGHVFTWACLTAGPQARLMKPFPLLASELRKGAEDSGTQEQGEISFPRVNSSVPGTKNLQ